MLARCTEQYLRRICMLPIIDYGGIAIVVPKITAVGGLINDEKFGFEVYLTGMEEPLIIGFETAEEAEESRDELVAIIAQYHYAKEFGPDFDIEEIENLLDPDGAEQLDDDDDDKETH